MKYEELSRAALIKLLQEHDAERAEAGRDGIVLNYSGRTAPWQIVRQVKPRMFDLGSPPFSRTLTRRPIKAMRSVHVEAK
ncbi:hypothetical protein, partial [Stenotrophomonas maltophilia]|uniref:hypothetical protein n=1 Tax=Stenotrophomonas maltophilia TaxID=40324 RepID=UPI003CCE8316